MAFNSRYVCRVARGCTGRQRTSESRAARPGVHTRASLCRNRRSRFCSFRSLVTSDFLLARLRMVFRSSPQSSCSSPLNPATLPARLTVSEQWSEHLQCLSPGFSDNWLLLAANFHGLDVVRHIELAKIRYTLAWRERDFCAFEILVFIGMN